MRKSRSAVFFTMLMLISSYSTIELGSWEALASTDDIVIVVSPLAFLIKAELEKLHGFGISAVYVGEKASYSLQELKEGKL